MPGPTREENRRIAEERRKALVEKLLARRPVGNAPSVQCEVVPEAPAGSVAPSQSPLAAARSGQAQVALFDRLAPGQPLWPELWLTRLVDAFLSASVTKATHLALVWPGQIKSVALIHALATLERLAIGDKKGLRAFLYPTKRASFAALGQILLDPAQLGEWTRRYQTATKLAPGQPPIDGRDDPNKEMLLWAVQQAKESPPAISELLPHFDWQLGDHSWGNYGSRFLARTKKALSRKTKKELWKEEDGRITELGRPATAADALFGISHLANAPDRKAAFRELRGSGAPEAALFDLTNEIARTCDRNLPQLLPTVLSELDEGLATRIGALIVTDDPKTFFTLRKRLRDERRELQEHALLSLDDDYGLARSRLPLEVALPHLSLRNFRAVVLDQETAAVAALFWQVATELARDSAAWLCCRHAALFLLRLASLPAGYKQYATWVSGRPYAGVVASQTTWNGCEAALLRLEQEGALGHRAERIRRAVLRAGKLVTAYADATPMALRFAKEVAAVLRNRDATIAVAFRFNDDIPLAEQFLANYDGFPGGLSYEQLKSRIRLVNHREVPDVLAKHDPPSALLMSGLPNASLRLLLTSERIPDQVVIAADYRRANDLCIGLRALQTIEAYKPFRGRIAGLAQELEARIAELPKAIDADKLMAMPQTKLSLASAAADTERQMAASPESWRVIIEGNEKVAVGTRVYVYDTDEEPPFRLHSTADLRAGQLIFLMSEALKDMFETELIKVGKPIVRGSSFGEMLKHYHRDVLKAVERLFGREIKPAELARRIKERMVALDRTRAEQCSTSRIRYWTDIAGSEHAPAEDLRPHSTWSRGDFELFARALEIEPNLIALYWDMVINQRRALQEAGRELADRYAHVLFNEEAARLHYGLSAETIARLQHEAIRNTYGVIRTIPPVTKMAGSH